MKNLFSPPQEVGIQNKERLDDLDVGCEVVDPALPHDDVLEVNELVLLLLLGNISFDQLELGPVQVLLQQLFSFFSHHFLLHLLVVVLVEHLFNPVVVLNVHVQFLNVLYDEVASFHHLIGFDLLQCFEVVNELLRFLFVLYEFLNLALELAHV